MSADVPMNNPPAVVQDTSPISVSIRPDIELSDWRDQFLKLENGVRKLQWYLGDMAAFGLNRWPQAVQEFIDQSEFDRETIKKAAWVCKRIAPENRREGISFSVHAEVAALDPAEQTKWLDHYQARKTEGSYSISQLRCDIRQGLADPALKETSKPNRSVIRGIRDFLSFTKRQPDDFWTPDMRQSYKDELQPLVKFYNSL